MSYIWIRKLATLKVSPVWLSMRIVVFTRIADRLNWRDFTLNKRFPWYVLLELESEIWRENGLEMPSMTRPIYSSFAFATLHYLNLLTGVSDRDQVRKMFSSKEQIRAQSESFTYRRGSIASFDQLISSSVHYDMTTMMLGLVATSSQMIPEGLSCAALWQETSNMV